MTAGTSAAKHILLMGASDDRTVRVAGFDAKKQLVYEWDGHTDFGKHLRAPAAAKEYWHLLWFSNDRFNISAPKIVINCMANADIMTKALAKAQTIIDGVRQQWPAAAIFNPPAGILRTTRDAIYAQFHGLPGLDIPLTVRCRPASVADVLHQAETAGFLYPFIVRSCGSHGGKGVILIQSPAEVARLESLAFDGSDYYLTQFRDYRGADGLYTKLRFIMLGGRLYMRHAITSDGWSIHGRSRPFMESREDLQARERDLLDNFEHRVAPDALASLRQIDRALGLDYLGFDGAILPDGRFFVFEINASQNAMAPSGVDKFPYLAAPLAALIEGFNAVIAQKTAHLP